MKKKIIVTGGNGFIGKNLVKKLKKTYDVFILDKKFSKLNKNNIYADISEYSTLKKININNVYAIVHLAGQPSGPFSANYPELDARLNILGTINVIIWAKKLKIKKFIFSSTFTVYGDPQRSSGEMLEKDICKPKSMYAISKKTAETYVQEICQKEKINWIILRLFNVYGPGQNINQTDQGIVGIFINLIKNNNIVKITGSMSRYKDLVYISDVVDAFAKVISSNVNNQIFNIGSGKKITINVLIKKITKVFFKNNKKEIQVLNAPHGEIMGAYANIKKALKLINYKPKISLEMGLKKFNKFLKLK
jgi:UDP-glucose 4-epimerase